MRKLAACLLILLSLLVLAVSAAETDRSIKISSDSNIVFVKKQLKLQAEVTKLSDTAPTKTNLVWESDNPDIAKVNNGTVAGVSVGKATIKASARDNPDIYATYDIEVRVPVKSIKVDPARIEMYVGENKKDEVTMTVTVLPEDAHYKDVVMASSDENVATVDSNGKITAVGPGKAKISVTSTEPGSQAKADVSVTVKEYINKIQIEEKDVTVAEKKNKTIKVNVEPKTAANKKMKWISADESIAKATNSGQITGVGCGTTTVTVTTEDTGTISETIKVTVIKEIKKITVDNTKLVLEPGIDWKQKVEIVPEDATYQELSWQSSDEKIATVDSSGKITPISVGKCTITGAAQDGYNAKVQVAVEVKKHDVVITEPGPITVNFPTRDYESMAGMQVGNMFWGTIWKTTVKYSNGCATSAGDDKNKLSPVKPGSDIVSIVEKENKKTISKKKYTIYVAQSAFADAEIVSEDVDKSEGSKTTEEQTNVTEEVKASSDSAEVRFWDLPWKASLPEVEKLFSDRGIKIGEEPHYENAVFAKILEPLTFGDIPVNYITLYFTYIFDEDGNIIKDDDKNELFSVKIGFDPSQLSEMRKKLISMYQLSDDEAIDSESWQCDNVMVTIEKWTDNEAFIEMKDIDADVLHTRVIMKTN